MAAEARRVGPGLLLAAVALALQGCGEHFSDDVVSGVPLMDCPKRTFAVDDANGVLGYIPMTSANMDVQVVCPPGFHYKGPPLECSWVNKVCLVERSEPEGEHNCFRDYAFTEAGVGLTWWPEGRRPERVEPKMASWHLQVRKQLALAKREFESGASQALSLAAQGKDFGEDFLRPYQGPTKLPGPVTSTTTTTTTMTHQFHEAQVIVLPKPIPDGSLRCMLTVLKKEPPRKEPYHLTRDLVPLLAGFGAACALGLLCKASVWCLRCCCCRCGSRQPPELQKGRYARPEPQRIGARQLRPLE